jgi:hypothetical protein
VEASFAVEADHLVVRIQGKADPESITEVLRRVKDLALEESLARILIDTTRVERPLPRVTGFLAGESIAGILPPPFKVAVVSPMSPHARRLAEDAAINRGANVMATNNEQEALDWLLT